MLRQFLGHVSHVLELPTEEHTNLDHVPEQIAMVRLWTLHNQ